MTTTAQELSPRLYWLAPVGLHPDHPRPRRGASSRGLFLILDQRVKARLYGVHLIWVLNMFSLIIWVWWGNWQLNDIESFSPVHYVAMVLFSVVLYLMCGLLFPVKGGEVEDFFEQFELNRSRFFYLGLALLFVIGTRTPVRIYQTALAIAFFVFTLRWIFTE